MKDVNRRLSIRPGFELQGISGSFCLLIFLFHNIYKKGHTQQQDEAVLYTYNKDNLYFYALVFGVFLLTLFL